MKNNGDAFAAFVENSIDLLGDKKVIDYYREPLPSATDEKMAAICERFMAASLAERETFQKRLSQEQRSLFGIYGHRAATLSVREESRTWLLSGLVGATISNYVIPDNRNVTVGLAIYHHCARRLGLNPAELFAEAARFASLHVAQIMIAFGKRSDVTLSKFGWKELQTPQGVKYKFSWG